MTRGVKEGAAPFPGLHQFTLDTYLILLSVKKEVSSINFKVFGMTRPGIKPNSPGLLATLYPFIYMYICMRIYIYFYEYMHIHIICVYIICFIQIYIYTYIYIYIYTYIYTYISHHFVGRMFANGLGDWALILRRVKLKTHKWYLLSPCLNPTL